MLELGMMNHFQTEKDGDDVAIYSQDREHCCSIGLQWYSQLCIKIPAISCWGLSDTESMLHAMS